MIRPYIEFNYLITEHDKSLGEFRKKSKEMSILGKALGMTDLDL